MSKPNRNKFNPVALDHPVNGKIMFEQILVTPEIAAEMLQHNEHNRNLRPGVVKTYARDMTAGNWRATGEAIKFDWHGRMVDGQHRLHAIIESGASVSITVIRGLDPETQTVMDVGAKRSPMDALRWNGVTANVSELAAMARIAKAHDSGQLQNAASALGGESRITNSEVLEWVEKTPLSNVAASMGRRFHRGIGGTPSAVGFAALKMLEVDEVDALEFLSSTAEFRTQGSRDPRSVLIRTLARLKGDRVYMAPALQLALIFRAWNAWRGQRQLATLPLKSGSGPVSIPEPK